jgi:hypothetical protein
MAAGRRRSGTQATWTRPWCERGADRLAQTRVAKHTATTGRETTVGRMACPRDAAGPVNTAVPHRIAGVA